MACECDEEYECGECHFKRETQAEIAELKKTLATALEKIERLTERVNGLHKRTIGSIRYR